MNTICRRCNVEITLDGSRLDFCPHCGERLLDETEFSPSRTQTHLSPFSAGEQSGEGSPVGAGDSVGPYRLLNELGRGGMGEVWEAENADTHRRVALKVLSPRIAQTEEAVNRFIREGRLAASLSHPRSTFVFGAGHADGRPYIAMELMPGKTLSDLVQSEGQLPVQRAVDLILDVIDGLLAAHELGVIHRDVKPSNCFLDGDGRAKIGDFGLSKSLVSDASLTRTGAFMGTPLFAAPEQVRGSEVDERTDLYAVGATLFYLIAGRGPFDGDAMAVVAQIVSDPPASLRSLRSDVPLALDRIISRTLEKDPAKRYSDLRQLRLALAPFASGGTSIADVGRRIAAYTLDGLAVAFTGASVFAAVGLGQAIIASYRQTADPTIAHSPTFNPVTIQTIQPALLMIYFFLCEGAWGCGVGKWAMGLRVVTLQGETPGFARSALRALVLPGCFGLTVAIPFLLSQPTAGMPSSPNQMAMNYATSIIVFVLTISMLSTMRQRNGYRGVHDWASGTRVVRWNQRESVEPIEVPAIAPISVEETVAYGPFEVVGRIGSSGPSNVYLGRDQLLHRSVWVRIPADNEQVAEQAVAGSRPTKPQFLQTGNSEEQSWAAFEAINGSPLSVTVAQFPGGVDWEIGRLWLLDLARELAASAREGRLPKQISPDQVWIDRGGRLKLLNDRLILAGREADENPFHAMQPVALLRVVANLISKDQWLTTSVAAFLRDLESRPEDEASIEWIVDRLESLCHERTRLRWDDRLGMLGATMGTEMTFYLFATFLLGWAAGAAGMSSFWIVLLPFVLLASASFVLGCVFRGGPIFRFTSVEVLDTHGTPASALRCGWRNLVTWTPFVFFYSTIFAMSVQAMAAGNDGQMKPDEFQRSVGSLLPAICVSECLFGFFMFGAVYVLFHPQRGLQDLLAGTRLSPLR